MYTANPSFSGSGAVSGPRCQAIDNGLVEAAGYGASFYPGTTPCTTSNGGALSL